MRFLLALLVLLPFTTVSQIVIDRSDYGNIGDTVFLFQSNDPLDTISIGSSGAGQTWDFSFLTVDSIPDTLLFLDTVGFTQAQTVPDANLVLKDGLSLQFLEENNNNIFVHSLALSFDTFLTNVAIIPQPKLILAQFPIQLGQIVSGNYASNDITIAIQDTLTIGGFSAYVDSIRITPTLQKIDSAKASGTLILPDQKSYDVVQQKTTFIISVGLEALVPNPLFPPIPPPFIWFPIPAGSFPDFETNTYNFIAKGKNYPIMELTTDSTNTITSARFQMDTSSIDTVTAFAKSLGKIKVYPNPVSEFITVENLTEKTQYQIADPIGRIVRSGMIQQNKNHIDFIGLPRGMYILRLEGFHSRRISQIRVLKE
jgi:hypothetical protein